MGNLIIAHNIQLVGMSVPMDYHAWAGLKCAESWSSVLRKFRLRGILVSLSWINSRKEDGGY